MIMKIIHFREIQKYFPIKEANSASKTCYPTRAFKIQSPKLFVKVIEGILIDNLPSTTRKITTTMV